VNVVRAWACALGILGPLVSPPLLAQSADIIGLPLGSVPASARVQDLNGNAVHLSRWIGKTPVLIEFWASWCPQCAELLPELERAHRRFGRAVEFLVVAVGVNQTPRSVARHLQRHPMPFTVLWDAAGAAVRAFQAPATSYVVVLDAAGRVAYTGMGGDQELEEPLARVVGDLEHAEPGRRPHERRAPPRSEVRGPR